MTTTSEKDRVLAVLELQSYRFRASRLTRDLRACAERELREVRAEIAEVYAQRDALAARLAEDRALLDAIRDAVGGGPYDTIARRVAELIEAADCPNANIVFRESAPGCVVVPADDWNRLCAARARCKGTQP